VRLAVSGPPNWIDTLDCFPSNGLRPLLGAGQGVRRAGTERWLEIDAKDCAVVSVAASRQQ
jgi:hypothetical protein